MLLYTSHRRKFAIRFVRLVDIDAELAQIDLGNLNLLHQLLMRLRHVIECEDTPAEAEQQRGAKADEQPQGKLQSWLAAQPVAVHGAKNTYHGDDLFLELGRYGENAKVQGKVEL